MINREVIADNSTLILKTRKYLGRSLRKHCVVDKPPTRNEIGWNEHNLPLSRQQFEQLYQRILSLGSRTCSLHFNGYMRAERNYCYDLQVINK